MMWIEIKNLVCEFPDGEGKSIRALTLPYGRLEEGAWALIGPSGSGKTTLLHCLSGLVQPTGGSITMDGELVTENSETAWCRFRAEQIGYVFQKPLLLPYLTVAENLKLSASLQGKSIGEEEIATLLSSVGLAGYEKRKPSHLSGGEAQRVSFLRAILRKPALLLADEPTASLDRENGELLVHQLLAYQKDSGCLLLCATHDPWVQAQFSHQFFLRKESVSTERRDRL